MGDPWDKYTFLVTSIITLIEYIEQIIIISKNPKILFKNVFRIIKYWYMLIGYGWSLIQVYLSGDNLDSRCTAQDYSTSCDTFIGSIAKLLESFWDWKWSSYYCYSCYSTNSVLILDQSWRSSVLSKITQNLVRHSWEHYLRYSSLLSHQNWVPLG